MRYAAHETLVAPARASSHPLRLVAGAVLVVVFFLPMAFLYAGVAPAILGFGNAERLILGQSPGAVLVLLFEFVFLIVALAMVLRLLHRRGLLSLVGPLPLVAAQFLRCALALLPLYLLFLVLPLPDAYSLSPNLAFGDWLRWLPLALPCLAIQIGAEELAFRGYMQSQLAARFANPLVWMGVPSALFGLLHYDPVLAGQNAWVLAVWAAVFGIAAADLTARTGTLGPALALHFVNNLFAIFFTAPEGDLDGLSLFTFPLSLDEAGLAMVILPLELLFTLCAWLAARLALRV